MPQKSLSVNGYSAEKIYALLRSDEHYVLGMRLYAVYLVSRGKSSRKLEELYDTSFKQITNWVHRFEKEGIDGLRDRKGRGRKKTLSKAQMVKLKKAIERTPAKTGYEAITWSGPLVDSYLKESLGVSFKRAQVYNIIKDLGFTFQKGKGFV